VPALTPVIAPPLTDATVGSVDVQVTGTSFKSPSWSVTRAEICLVVAWGTVSDSTERTTWSFDCPFGLVDSEESLSLHAVPSIVTAAATMCRSVMRIKSLSAMTVRRPDWHGAIDCAVAS
jgi:hypothetical protein